jgi:glutathione S-transferase
VPSIVRDVVLVYDRAGAGRPPRVRWALEEAGVSYDRTLMSTEEAAGEEHRRRHPLGRVPVLVTEDGPLFESAAICLQIADSYPEAGLIPSPGSYDRGLVYQWVLFAMTELEPAVVHVSRAQRSGDAAAAAAGQPRLDEALAILDRHLDGCTFMVGDRFSVADIVVGGVLTLAHRRDLLPNGSASGRYLERLDARPAKRRAYE